MKVFERRGHAITMDDVAAEAQVSKGTVYTTFGTRAALVEEMVVQFLEASEEHYRSVSTDQPAWDALVESVLTPTIGVASTAEVLDPDAPDGPVHQAQARLEERLSELLERGKAEGSIRPEITVDNVKLLFRGLYSVLPEYSPERATIAREHGYIILRGLRT